MRTIKFRAWDEKQKYMAYQGTHDLETIQSFFHHFGNCELMQFTGLTDKNGVEIYEGDILQKYEIDYDLFEEMNYEGEHPMKITKKDVATMDRFPIYWLKNETFGYEGEDLETTDEWEIIGNIHENPEMI